MAQNVGIPPRRNWQDNGCREEVGWLRASGQLPISQPAGSRIFLLPPVIGWLWVSWVPARKG